MEVDVVEDDLDLINRLNTLATRDKEELLNQFQAIVGKQMSPGCCSFYLEMGNWNIQNALCGYYDLLGSNERLPNLEVVEESYHIKECSLAPNQSFIKFWKVKNTGNERWPQNLKLKFLKGQNFNHGEVVSLSSIQPGETLELRIQMVAPNTFGLYQALWRGVTVSGAYFGVSLSVAVNVESPHITNLTDKMALMCQPETDESDLTQQMASLGQSNVNQLLLTQQMASLCRPNMQPSNSATISSSSSPIPQDNIEDISKQ